MVFWPFPEIYLRPEDDLWGGFFLERLGNTSMYVLDNLTAANARSKTTWCSEKNYLGALTMTVSSVAVMYSASLLEAQYKLPPRSLLLALHYLIEHHLYTKMVQRIILWSLLIF
jgi:hypothetical protein